MVPPTACFYRIPSAKRNMTCYVFFVKRFLSKKCVSKETQKDLTLEDVTVNENQEIANG